MIFAKTAVGKVEPTVAEIQAGIAAQIDIQSHAHTFTKLIAGTACDFIDIGAVISNGGLLVVIGIYLFLINI